MYSKEQINEARYAIANAIRPFCEMKDDTIIISAFLLYLASGSSAHFSFDDIKNKKLTSNLDVVNAVRLLINEEAWNALGLLLEQYPAGVFKEVVKANNEDIFSTPDSVIRLVLRLLDIKGSDRVADIGCGTGSFLTSAAKASPEAGYYGCELNPVTTTVARIRAELLMHDEPKARIDIQNYNAFALDEDRYGTFDKVFSNYPFGLQAKNADSVGYLEMVTSSAVSVKRVRSADWLYNHLAIQLLKEEGKAVVLMPDGGLFNSLDKDIRAYFLEKGWIEAVIHLPAKLFSYTSIGTNAVILSRGNKKIRFVDAAHIFQKERRVNVLSDDDVDMIVGMLTEDSEHSVSVDGNVVLANDAELMATEYLKVDDSFIQGLNPTPLNSVTETILRGAPATAKELDDIVSLEPTEYQFLMLSNIRDGNIDEDLPYIKSLDEKNLRYRLEDGDLIVSKTAAPIKTAVIKVPEGKTIIANGNMFVLRLKKDQIIPHYLQAFFLSESGQSALDSISNGTVLKNISIESLRKMEIPVPDMETQKKIADEFEAKLQELRMLEKRSKRVRKELTSVFVEAITLSGEVE